MVALLTYHNIFPLRTNNRLIAYYRHLEEQGYQPCFFFIKGRITYQGYRIRSFQTALVNIPFLGVLLGIFRACIFFLRQQPTAHIYLYDPSALWWPLLMIWRWKGFHITIERNELHAVQQVKGIKQKLLKWVYTLDERLNKHPLVLISRSLEQHFLRHNNRVLFRLPAFVEQRFFDSAPPVHNQIQYRVAYLGSFGEKDNVNGIIHALKSCVEDLPQLQFHLYGNCPTAKREKFQNISGNLPLYFHGAIPYECLCQTLQQNDLLISNRDNSTYSGYGFPTKLIEYLASGIPVIATPSAGVKELFPGNVLYLLPDYGHERLSQAIRQRYTSYDDWNVRAAHGRDLVLAQFEAGLFIPEWEQFVLHRHSAASTPHD